MAAVPVSRLFWLPFVLVRWIAGVLMWVTIGVGALFVLGVLP